MADQKQNKITSGISDAQTELKKQLKELIEDQGDYNNLLKQAISSLDSVDKHYVRIASRIDSINKDTINVKEVNKELRKLVEKRFIAEKNYSDLAKNISQNSKALAHFAEKSANSHEEAVEFLKAQGDLEAVALYAAKQNLVMAEKKAELGEQALLTEKKLQKSIGYTGATFKLFADKLGVGNEYYEQMVIKARRLEAENKKLTFFDKLIMLSKASWGGLTEALKDPMTAIPMIAGGLFGLGGILIKGLKAAFDYITAIQDQTMKFARAMNMSTQEARKLKMEFASLSISSGDLFINSQKMVESQMELTDAFGVTNMFSNQILATNIKLKDISGLELDTRQGIAEASVITGKSSESVVKSVLAQVEGLKRVTGIQFQNQKILKEASNLGGVLGLQFAKYPDKLTKSLLTVKAMGLELKQLDQMADSFLDFESSISAEFEAQLLTGRDINMNKARELFLNNDLAGAALEINRQVGSSSDFLKMNRIQAESLAKAFGMSRDQLGDMLKRQEMLSRLGAKDTDNARKQLQIGLERYKTHKALSAAIGEEAYQNLTNASLQEKIAAFMEKIKQSIADFVEKSGLIDKIENFFNFLSEPKNIRAIISKVRDFFAGAVEFIGTAAYYILEGLDYVAFGQIPNDFIESIKAGSENMGAQIRALGGDMAFTGPSVSANRSRLEASPAVANAGQGRSNSGFSGQTTIINNIVKVENEVVGKSAIKHINNSPQPKTDGGTGRSVATGGTT